MLLKPFPPNLASPLPASTPAKGTHAGPPSLHPSPCAHAHAQRMCTCVRTTGSARISARVDGAKAENDSEELSICRSDPEWSSNVTALGGGGV
ncbi:hypothetical protein JB92DRAFT_986291 [Gautieria morchelliformis]|nr:hypothetical protein JB92DRAFT_986291 [Gautieria morchelliformis]